MHIRPVSDLLDHWRDFALPFANRPRLLKSLDIGTTNRSYLINGDGDRWVLRLNRPSASELGIDRQREKRILRAASGVRLAPEVLCCNLEHGYLVTKFIDGERWSAGDLSGRQIKQLFALLAQLTTVSPDVSAIDYRVHVDTLHAHVKSQADLTPSAIFADIDTLYANCAPGLCHHDPSPQNVIADDGKLTLLDWEYAALGLPIMDYAALAVEWSIEPALVVANTHHTAALLASATNVYRYYCSLWHYCVNDS